MLPTIKQKTQFVKGNTGFTLIEVLIAMAIFSIGILGVAALQSGSIRGNTSARGVTDIAVIATDWLEMLRSLPYDDDALVGGPFGAPVTHTPLPAPDGSVPPAATDRIDNNYDGLIDEDNETGPLSIQYTVTTDWPIERTKTIEVTVTHDGASVRKQVTMQQIIPLII
jgi:type IV pilus assembly protein PilV